jgi:3-phenylpropionate/trans-cinnamate dioxygenase ferredoxin reductase subunit
MTTLPQTAEPHHYVIIGSGVAGNHAAEVLRDREPECRITIVTNNRLLFYNRYLLPQIFLGAGDGWQRFLAYPPQHYMERRMQVRRDTVVTRIDSGRREITFGHGEVIAYDKLLVASGARGYLPEELAEYRALIHPFGSYEQAIAVRRALPDSGTVIMLGGDMIGLDLARSLTQAGHRVVLVTGEFTFWPHTVIPEERDAFCEALERMGIERISNSGGVDAIEAGAPGRSARRVVLRDGREIHGDVVLSFMGLVPSVDFMLGSGVDIERGLLVDPTLRTSDPHIYAAGDVCQIWSAEDHGYRFYYGYRNVRAMGELAALNMTGAGQEFVSTRHETLRLDDHGHIDSPFWECEC